MKEIYPCYIKGELDKAGEKIKGKEKEAFDEFLKKCSITSKEKKLEQIKKIIFQFRDVTQLSLIKQDKQSVDSFLVLLSNAKNKKGENKSDWTKDEIKVYVKQFLKWYYKDLEMIENFKAVGKKGLNPQKITENNLITEEDIEKMLRYAQSYKEKSYLLLVFQTGARPQELIMLKWKSVKFEDKYADITLFSTKTERSRTFPVVKKTKDALWEWKQHFPYTDVKPNDYVFPSRWRDKPMTSDGLNKMLRRMAKSAGLNKSVWGYLFRHSRATRLYEELPQPIVEKLMGHQDMAKIYAHISSKKAREMMLEKVYNIEELTEKDKDQIKELKAQLGEQDKRLKEFEAGMPEKIQQQLNILMEKKAESWQDGYNKYNKKFDEEAEKKWKKN